MIIPIAVGLFALYGAYRYSQMRSTTAAQATAAPVPSAETSGYVGSTKPAANPTGSIQYTPSSNLPGFNVPVQHVVVQAGGPNITYPPATTVTDPRNMGGTIATWNAANPAPSNVYYYPAANDIWPLISARLGGTPKARLVDPKNNSATPLSLLSLADVGKLNGIVSLRDIDNWLKAGKPLHLPVGGWNDVSGPVQNAMGSIR